MQESFHGKQDTGIAGSKTKSKNHKLRDVENIPFPTLPYNWRYSVSKSNRYYFWQKGSKESTYKHPTTGKEYKVDDKPFVPSTPDPSSNSVNYSLSTPGSVPPRPRDTSRVRSQAEEYLAESAHRGRSRSLVSVSERIPSRASSHGSVHVRASSASSPRHYAPTGRMTPGTSTPVGMMTPGRSSTPSTREQVEELNKEFHAQRISQEQYVAQWQCMFENIRDQKRSQTPACMAQQAAQNAKMGGYRANSRGREYSQHRAGSWQPPQPQPQPHPQPGSVSHRHGSMSITTTSTHSSASSHRSRRSTSMPSSWSDRKVCSHPDPAPHLNHGVRHPAPGPRINPNPPAPPQYAPHFGIPAIPAPNRPQPMTTLAPPLRNGCPLSPPEGEIVTKHTFNFSTKSWATVKIRVRIDKYPFQEGTLRSVFYMKDFSRPAGPRQDYVAKISKDPREPVESYFQDCEMQALAAYLAQEFNKLSLPKKIDYLEASVIECHDRVSPVPGGRVVFAVEPYIHGTFCKYTNNYGWINPGAPRNSPQTFSHFTHYFSQGTLVVVDIQGITDEDGNDHYTDPQIHTRPGLPSFGKADLRAEGIQKFFETHECNSICHALGLPRVKNGKVIHDTSGQQRTLPVPNPNLIWELKKYCSEARD